jgi:methyl-accepting chemotaxis protein
MSRKIDQAGISNPTEQTKNIEQFTKDHYIAVVKINHLLQDNLKFDGGDDHTLCNFGLWLSSFTTESKELQDLIEKISDPHKRFHTAVKKIKELTYAGKLAEAQAVDKKDLDPAMKDVFGEFEELRKLSSSVLDLEQNVQKQLFGPVTARQREAVDLLQKLVQINKDNSEKSISSLQNISNSSRTLLSIIAVIGLIVAMILGIALSNGITRPIKIAIEGMTSATEQVSAAALQLSSASQELSSGASEQASSIEETSASLEEMGGMVQNNVTNAQKAKDLAGQVKQVSEMGDASMEKLQSSMKEILESNEKIEQLVKVIGEIGEKTKVMDEIVFQTKLLSFNASVEAERAGEHGRGFAVVAQEVGNLAQMSGKSAQEISQIVTSSIRQAEAITAENKKKVEQGNSYVIETGKYLKEIMNSAATVTDGAQQVVAASQEQASGIKQINLAMSNLDKATQQNASMAEETASTSEELSAQTGTLNDLVADLVRLVDGSSAMTDSAMRNSNQPSQKRSPLKLAHSGGKSMESGAKKTD